jgi:hypothetical protein
MENLPKGKKIVFTKQAVQIYREQQQDDRLDTPPQKGKTKGNKSTTYAPRYSSRLVY